MSNTDGTDSNPTGVLIPSKAVAFVWSGRKSVAMNPPQSEYRGLASARKPAGLFGVELYSRLQGYSLAELKDEENWKETCQIPFIEKSECFGGTSRHAGWMFCDGQLLPIAENDAIFTLIGTTYGGDGQSTFAPSNLQSRVPIRAGTGGDGITYQLAEQAGVESVTLTVQQIPIHTHPLLGSNTTATTQLPGGNIPAQGAGQIYTSANSPIQIAPQAVGPNGGSQPHENLQPYLCISFIISLFGIFPSQT